MAQVFLVSRAESRRVILASSAGTVFEWYDFYLYAVLAPFFARLFFPAGNGTAALLAAFATYAAGFIVRPFGAVLFGRLGDLIGRKFIFLVSIVIMGFSTFTVGLLPSFEQIGWAAPVLLVFLRLVQGLALGGEYGGAATYVAEYNAAGNRGYATSWIQTTASMGLLFSLAAIGLCRLLIEGPAFEQWGWRLPFLLSIILLGMSVYMRVTLRETPVFLQMKAEGRSSKIPLWESFFRWPNNKYIFLSLFGATAGQGVVWYTGQFYALFFLIIALQLDYLTSYILVGSALALGMPFFVFFGWFSDRIGRLNIILSGCFLAAVTYLPLFKQLTLAVNPALAEFQAANPAVLRTDLENCNLHIFVGPWSTFSVCDQVADALTSAGIPFKTVNSPGAENVELSIGSRKAVFAPDRIGETRNRLHTVLFAAGYPGLNWKHVNGEPQTDDAGNPVFEFGGVNRARINYPAALGVLFALMLYVTMVYGPIAAFLVELFPPQVRYTSLSFPYHIGNGIFGGLLPLVSTALAARTGDIYAGLWYPIAVAASTCIIGALFLRGRRREPL